MRKRIISILITLIAFYSTAYPQQQNLSFIKEELYRINKYLDSAKLLSFNVDIAQTSDTVLGRSENYRQTASYILDGRRYYCNAGDIELVQTDSFIITVSSAEQQIVATKSRYFANSNFFPLKEFVDSLVDYFNSKYQVTLTGNDTVNCIRFFGNDEDLPFNDFLVFYYPSTLLLKKIEVSYRQQPMFDMTADSISNTSSPPLPAMINKRMTMEFRDYSFSNNDEVFDENKYLYFDRKRKVYVATGKYTGYRLRAPNLETAQSTYDDIETATPIITEDNNDN